MKLIPMLFSTPMVLALLAGNKTQTRRLVKSSTGTFDVCTMLNGTITDIQKTNEHGEHVGTIKCPYGQIGDVIWVRETFTELIEHHREGMATPYVYRADIKSADSDEYRQAYIKAGYPYQWKPSLFMPLAACRLFLEIVSIRVERLNDISLEDARAEGIVETWGDGGVSLFPKDQPHEYDNRTSVENYAKLWHNINGPDSWKANPFVWVISFRQIPKPVSL